MEHEEHHKIVIEEITESKAPKESKEMSPANTIAMAIVLGAILISATLFYNAGLLVKKLDSAIFASDDNTSAILSKLGSGGGTAAAAPTPGEPVKVSERSDAPVKGKASAKVTIVEFGDFQCPYCKNFFQTTLPQIQSKYIDTGKVKLEFRHYPLTQIHAKAEISSVAAECANRQGKFWQYHDLLYQNGQADGAGLDKDSLVKYANQLGLNSGTLGFGKNKFNQCLDSNATLDVVNKDLAEGGKDGVSGTPSFFINGQQIVGAQPFAQFQTAIEAALAGK